MPVKEEKWEQLRARMKSLSISEEDLAESFIVGSGRGGQKMNKTASCVRLKHLPTGLEVKCQEGRERSVNRYKARVLLCDKIDPSRKREEAEKIRKQKNRRKRRHEL